MKKLLTIFFVLLTAMCSAQVSPLEQWGYQAYHCKGDTTGHGSNNYRFTNTSIHRDSAGTTIVFTPLQTNTGTSTIKVNGFAVHYIKKKDGVTNVGSGDLIVGVPYLMTFDGTYWQLNNGIIGATGATGSQGIQGATGNCNNAWQLNGNSGTGDNGFMGTTDTTNFVLKTADSTQIIVYGKSKHLFGQLIHQEGDVELGYTHNVTGTGLIDVSSALGKVSITPPLLFYLNSANTDGVSIIDSTNTVKIGSDETNITLDEKDTVINVNILGKNSTFNILTLDYPDGLFSIQNSSGNWVIGDFAPDKNNTSITGSDASKLILSVDSSFKNVGKFENTDTIFTHNVIPKDSALSTLGTAKYPYKDLFVTNNSIHFGTDTLSSSNGNLYINRKKISLGTTAVTTIIAQTYIATPIQITCGLCIAGDIVSSVANIAGGDISSNFESTISITGKLIQTGGALATVVGLVTLNKP